MITEERAQWMRAVLDGKVLQYKSTSEAATSCGWSTANSDADAMHILLKAPTDYTFRVKPEPIERWLGVHKNGDLGPARASKELALIPCDGDAFAKALRVALNPEDLTVLVAYTEAP